MPSRSVDKADGNNQRCRVPQLWDGDRSSDYEQKVFVHGNIVILMVGFDSGGADRLVSNVTPSATRLFSLGNFKLFLSDDRWTNIGIINCQ